MLRRDSSSDEQIKNSLYGQFTLRDAISLSPFQNSINQMMIQMAQEQMTSKLRSIHIACLIDNRGRLLCTSDNYQAYHHRTSPKKTRMCAEAAVFRDILKISRTKKERHRIKKDIHKMTIMVIRVKNGLLRNSEPCYYCQLLKKKFGMSIIFPFEYEGNIYYTKI